MRASSFRSERSQLLPMNPVPMHTKPYGKPHFKAGGLRVPRRGCMVSSAGAK